MPDETRQALPDHSTTRKPPPGRYAQGKRSPIVWVLLCDVCAGFALNVDESYRGYLSGRCQGCGCDVPEMHRFRAYIATAEGCDDHSGSCAGRHPRVFGDLHALGGDELEAVTADRDEAVALLRHALPLMPDEDKPAWFRRWGDLLGRHTPDDDGSGASDDNDAPKETP